MIEIRWIKSRTPRSHTQRSMKKCTKRETTSPQVTVRNQWYYSFWTSNCAVSFAGDGAFALSTPTPWWHNYKETAAKRDGFE